MRTSLSRSISVSDERYIMRHVNREHTTEQSYRIQRGSSLPGLVGGTDPGMARDTPPPASHPPANASECQQNSGKRERAAAQPRHDPHPQQQAV